jgi:hypothetical protein
MTRAERTQFNREKRKAEDKANWEEYNRRAAYCEAIAKEAYDKAYRLANRTYDRLKREGGLAIVPEPTLEPNKNEKAWMKMFGVTW